MTDIKADKILFLDIETVPQTRNLSDMSEDMILLWSEKFNILQKRWNVFS